MKGFISFADNIEQLITKVMQSSELHAKWLNTLSYLENCGARKIAACQHPTQVKEEMLKHAAEEFRHAYYLKKQIGKIATIPDDYSLQNIFGGISTLQYLTALNLQTCRYLIDEKVENVTEYAYLLVTYAIELRASELYPIYDKMLKERCSKVAVKSILLEEKEHLNEMIAALKKLPLGFEYATKVCAIESHLCSKWINVIFGEFRIQNSE